MKPRTLLQRCQGARAIPVEQLVRKGEAKAAEIVKEFGRYALRQLEELEALAKKAFADRHDENAWRGFTHALRDAHSSSATAGAPWIEAYAGHLAGEVARREKHDAHLPQLVRLHLDAMKLAAAGVAGEDEMAKLNEKLKLASAKLAAEA